MPDQTLTAGPGDAVRTSVDDVELRPGGPTRPKPAPLPRPRPPGPTVGRALTAFYAVVALVALAGQAGAAVTWLRWPPLAAVTGVAAVEFGGIVLSAFADHRRRLGERAIAARLLSAAVAAGAVAVNWVGHPDHLQGGFFAGMSALGYLVWLLHSGARRRDQLRAVGSLPPVAPVYGPWAWLRRPGVTRRARALALADPTLGLYRSLTAARTAERAERRQAAIAALLRRKLAAGRDRLAGEIAVTVYDLDAIAARLAAAADYDGLTALLAADLTPDRLTAPTVRTYSSDRPDNPPTVTPDPEPTEAPDASTDAGRPQPQTSARTSPTRTPRARPNGPRADQLAKHRRADEQALRTLRRQYGDRAPQLSAWDIRKTLSCGAARAERLLTLLQEGHDHEQTG